MNIKLYQNDIPKELLLNKNDIAVDTETMGLSLNRDRLCLLQFSFGDSVAHLVKFNSREIVAPNLVELLQDKSRQKIFHFARFDVAMIQKNLNVFVENIFCTKIASKLVRTYTDSHGLKELCRELLNIQISKQQQSSDWGGKDLSKDQLEYAAKDVLYLHEIRKSLKEKLQREGRYEIATNAFEFLKFIVQMDLLGYPESGNLFAHM
jgi:ribonuclease D